MEVENGAQEYSKEELRRQLYASLRSTGVLDSMKGQLRARLLEHLRHHKEDLMQPKKKQGKPSLIARLLSSLFLDYLESNGFTFTVSVFMPESQMASWPPFSYQEMLELLHLDPSSDLHVRLKLGGEGGECLAYQLVTVLQQMASRSSCIQEVSTQTSSAEACKLAMRTSSTSSRELERSLKEVEDAYIRKKEAHDAQRGMPHRYLEDKLTVLHQEFDARVNAEVALQVNRIRDYEINAARMDEAARYRRQLARDREELEDILKSRMDRVKAREESLLERMLSKEKAIEASAYEQRQKILLEITSLRERETKLRQFKELQERREEKLDERELTLKAKEEEVGLERKALYAQADEIAALRRKELEEQYKELGDRLHHDRALLAAEREQMKEEKVAMSIELAASRSDKELIQALHRRLSVEEDQRLKLEMSIRELEDKLKQQTSSVNIPDQRFSSEQLRELQAGLEQERLQRQAIEKESKILERKLQQKKVALAAARIPQGEWITEHKNLMATIYKQEAELQKKDTKLQLMETEIEKSTDRHKKLLLKIDHLDTLVKKAQEEKDHLVHDLEILEVQQKTNERELLETTTVLRKTQQALEAERLEHCALRSHMNAVDPFTRNDLNNGNLRKHCGSQDKLEHSHNSVDYDSSVAVSFLKTRESFQKKPKPESYELWARLLSDNAAKKACLDQDLDRNHVLTSSTSKPFSSGNYENRSSNLNDMNGLTAITVEKLRTRRAGNTTVTKNETLMASSWDQEKYSYEDTIPSWRKAQVAEVATFTSWNDDYKDSMSSVQGLVANLQCDRSEVCIDDCRSGKDPVLSWNKTYFQGKMTEECDKESLRDLQGAEMTTQFRSPRMLETNSSSADLQNMENSKAPVDQIAFLNFNRSEGNEDDANHHGDGDLSVHDIAVDTHTTQEGDELVETQESDELMETQESDELVETQEGDELVETQEGDELVETQEGDELVETQEGDELVETQGAESLWSPYVREQVQHSRQNSEADEGSSQDSLSCMHKAGLKHDLESLASTQSKDETHMSSTCGPQMDSHSEGDRTPVGSTIQVPKKPTMMPEMKHSTAGIVGNEAREDTAEVELLSHEPVPQDSNDSTHKLTDEVNEVGMDGTSPGPTMTESEDDITLSSDKDLSHLMRKLGLPVVMTKNQERGSYKEAEAPKLSSLSPMSSKQDEESRKLLPENGGRASGRMSGLPEIGEMLNKQEIHCEKERAQKDLQSYLLQDCILESQNTTGSVELKDEKDIMFDPQQFSMLPDYHTYALETLRSSIVMRKQEVSVNKETDKESPRNHPTLVLAIRNNQLVKLEQEDELQKGERSTSGFSPSHPEVIVDTTSTCDESILRKESSNLIDEMSCIQQARNPISHTETDSSSGESAYKGDSFEEDEEEDQVDEGEDQVDRKTAYSEESCTNVETMMQTTKITGSSGAEQFTPEIKTKVEDNQSRSPDGSSENWEGESEQGSYSPDDDVTVSDYFQEPVT